MKKIGVIIIAAIIILGALLAVYLLSSSSDDGLGNKKNETDSSNASVDDIVSEFPETAGRAGFPIDLFG
jgi:hypothetical protein